MPPPFLNNNFNREKENIFRKFYIKLSEERIS